MTRYVIGKVVALRLAQQEAVIADEHALLAPMLFRSQFLSIEAEYIALTQLQADAFISLDTELASAA